MEKTVKIKIEDKYKLYKCIELENNTNSYTDLESGEVIVVNKTNQIPEFLEFVKGLDIVFIAKFDKYNTYNSIIYRSQSVKNVLLLHLIKKDLELENQLFRDEIVELKNLLDSKVVSIAQYSKFSNISRQQIYNILNTKNNKIRLATLHKIKNSNDNFKSKKAI